MGAGYFIIAILGCADGSASCTPVATAPVRYETHAQCVAAVNATLENNNDFDFPTLIAECRQVRAPASASRKDGPKLIPARAERS
jgi:hypothetical protein